MTLPHRKNYQEIEPMQISWPVPATVTRAFKTGGFVPKIDLVGSLQSDSFQGVGGSGAEKFEGLRPVNSASRETEQSLGKYVRFMPVALAFASLSKYPGTRVGCLILGPGFEVRASGWNGAPRGCKADEDSRLENRQERLAWAAHAEANSVANAARCGVTVEGCTMVVTHTPCMACAKLIVQSGIIRVISPLPAPEFERKWEEDFCRTRLLFSECGVDHIECDIAGV